MDIYNELKVEKINPSSLNKLENCVFKQNEANARFNNDALFKIFSFLDKAEVEKLCIVRTQKLDHIVLNNTISDLLNSFDGERNLRSIFEGIKKYDLDFFIFVLGMHHYLIELENISEDIETKSISFSLDNNFENLIRLIKLLFKNNLIEFVGYNQTCSNFSCDIKNAVKINFMNKKKHMQIGLYPLMDTYGLSSKVLLLGDTVGTNTVGLLYIASYLRRHGIEAYCQWNDPFGDKQLLKENVVKLLNEIKPHIVGVSMKWFPHIARVLEICKIVKDFSPFIKVVVGGDTATYYWKDIIKYECIDYIILGEGELPLLKLCQNEEYIPNCVYKKNGEIISSPHTYVQTEENNSDMYLSHMDQIFASSIDPYYASSMFIQTGKGCASNCFYCAGCLKMQKKNFKRYHPYLRDIEAVKNDIKATKEYVGTYLYDFELPNYDSLNYYIKLWQGIDLSNHYCAFYFWTLPSPDLLKLITKTYKYAYINIDLCSLSETHRMKLTDLKVVKPQPTDQELFGFLDIANEYTNMEVYINLIAGLPYFGLNEIEESDKALSKIMSKHKRFFCTLFWGRLHAQPGASLTYECEKYGMKSPAKNFEDFLHYSELNFDSIIYPNMRTLIYPTINYKDDYLESKVNEFYNETQKKLTQFYLSKI
ncbi:B12-binding domain-containing radical SAM protein [Desulfosporosinus nitroreducens]|uniref:B12-binding domain-containing radical SAM protein n=1 Tax=Desulfosporosinus nitroreducens TaxID=2018668 RepID=UPI00207D300F|nr:cobalamin-dependent protein [Desulfosporosinus nitroreducens]MCO1604457.1 cobalamin-dependent protein [Desulfosporosinus nitroreducens]